MKTEYRTVASWIVEDEATGERRSMTETLKVEVRNPHRAVEVATGFGRHLELDDGEGVSDLGDNRFRVGLHFFKRVSA